MNRELLLRTAEKLLAKHHLVGWKVELRIKTGHWLGRCDCDRKTILLSGYYADNNSEEEVLHLPARDRPCPDSRPRPRQSVAIYGLAARCHAQGHLSEARRDSSRPLSCGLPLL